MSAQQDSLWDDLRGGLFGAPLIFSALLGLGLTPAIAHRFPEWLQDMLCEHALGVWPLWLVLTVLIWSVVCLVVWLLALVLEPLLRKLDRLRGSKAKGRRPSRSGMRT